MPTGTIILIVSIVIILIIAYVACLIVRKRNDNLLVALEERKEELFNLPVNEEVEAVKALHLIGQSQVSFREWNQNGLICRSIHLPTLKIIFLRQKAITMLFAL